MKNFIIVGSAIVQFFFAFAGVLTAVEHHNGSLAWFLVCGVIVAVCSTNLIVFGLTAE